MNSHIKFANRTQNLKPSPIREILKYISIPGMISMGGGYPAPSTFPFKTIQLEFKDGIKINLSKDEIAQACQYGKTKGIDELIELIKSWCRFKDNVEIGDLNILNGSQEGIFILAYLLIEKNRPVIMSEPCYPGAKAAFLAFTNELIPVSISHDGMDMENLSEILKNLKENSITPAFIYTVPTGHNPAGVTMSLKKRYRLLELAYKFDTFILEDDPYQLVNYKKEKKLPTLYSLDTEGKVIRLDSFSKIFVPGMRIGYITANKEILRMVTLFKQAANLHTSTFNQVILLNYLKKAGNEGFYAHISRVCEFYKKNRDIAVKALNTELNEKVNFNVPDAGLFIWLELNKDIDTGNMFEKMREKHKVLMVKGNAFSLKNQLKNCARLSFGTLCEEEIYTGIKRFKHMIEEYSGNT